MDKGHVAVFQIGKVVFNLQLPLISYLPLFSIWLCSNAGPLLYYSRSHRNH